MELHFFQFQFATISFQLSPNDFKCFASQINWMFKQIFIFTNEAGEVKSKKDTV